MPYVPGTHRECVDGVQYINENVASCKINVHSDIIMQGLFLQIFAYFFKRPMLHIIAIYRKKRPKPNMLLPIEAK